MSRNGYLLSGWLCMLFMEFCFRIVLDGIVDSLFIFSYYIFVHITFMSFVIPTTISWQEFMKF